MLTVLLIVGVALSGAPLVISWLLYMLLMATFTSIVADGITDRKVGILIDERNKMSLSRLQMALWSMVVLSAFLAAAISNVRVNATDPLNIAIPEAVWLLMGISTTSLVGAPLILAAKGAGPTAGGPPMAPRDLDPTAAGAAAAVIPAAAPPRKPMPVAAASILWTQGENPSRMSVVGSVVVKHSVADARWADLFKGDEVGDVTTLDLAKIQMFFFTVVLVLSYAIAVGAGFLAIESARRELGPQIAATATAPPAPPVPTPPGTPAPPTPPGAATSPSVRAAPADRRQFEKFPPLDLGFVTLLGISNAGFLVNRAIPRDQPPPAPT